ncbi:uncharacterized protein Dere_GG18249 [Drosophila erecta]|uniref:TATA box-binding protein-like 1 n=1 Tax=Drosophila erecta TaxID=7220 RepID=B3NVI5_DROER|nr:uncharacterized protein Dere_GG18249 [Drosophila erecta]
MNYNLTSDSRNEDSDPDPYPEDPVGTDERNTDILVSGEADSQGLNEDSDENNLQSPNQSPNSNVIEYCEQGPEYPVGAAPAEEVQENEANSSGNKSDWYTRNNRGAERLISGSDSEDERWQQESRDVPFRRADSDYSVEIRRNSQRDNFYRGYDSGPEGRFLRWSTFPDSSEDEAIRPGVYGHSPALSDSRLPLSEGEPQEEAQRGGYIVDLNRQYQYSDSEEEAYFARNRVTFYGYQPNRESESDSDNEISSTSSESSSTGGQSSDDDSRVVSEAESSSLDTEDRVDPVTGWISCNRVSVSEREEEIDDKQQKPSEDSEDEQKYRQDEQQGKQQRKRKLLGRWEFEDDIPIKGNNSTEPKKLKKPTLQSERDQSEEEREDTESEESDDTDSDYSDSDSESEGGPGASHSEEPAQDKYPKGGGADQDPAPEGGADQDPAPEGGADQDLTPEGGANQDPAPAPENNDQICEEEDEPLFYLGKREVLKFVSNPLGDDLTELDVKLLLYMTFGADKLEDLQSYRKSLLLEQQRLFVQEKVRQQKEQHRWQQDQVERERQLRQQEEQKRLEYERNLERQREDCKRQLRLQREQYLIKIKQLEKLRQRQQQENRPYNTQPQRKHELMQNDMVSIPVANLNGGLKAASSGSGVGVVAAGGVVSSAVLANAPRVYLTPSSTFMANRQMAGVATTGKISGPVVGGSAGTTSAAGTVRYFSQFSKVQTAGGPSLQRKLANGDTIVLANGNKSMFLTSSDNKGALQTVATNGNGLLTAKTELLEEEGMQPVTVIDDEGDDEGEGEGDGDGDGEESSNNAKSSGDQQPMALTNAANEGNGSDDEPELDIVINNVVCSFSVGCHLKLRDIALQGSNVEYRRENGMVTMKLRHPYTTASIWSSGRITCTGATSEAMAKVAARRYARCLGKLGFPTRFLNFRIVNVLGTCSMPWAIKIVNFSERHRENASYEPELHPGVTYKMRDPDPKATLKIFSTGSVTVTAASVSHVESAIQHIYPLVFDFRKKRSAEELQHLRQKQRLQGGGDPNELEKNVLADNKTSAQDNIFINTTAAHSKSASAGILSSTIDSMPRLKQIVNYHQMMKQTQDERRHIPFHGEKVNPASTSSAAAAPSTSSSSSSGDNICANARRRATECWATKLQNKRPRYNDPGTTGTINASSSSASATSSFAPQANPLRNPLKTAALANARMRGAKVPTCMVTGTRIASNSLILHQQQLVHMQQQQQQKLRQTSFSPSEFNVDDLIEEESNELDMHF